MTDNADLRNPDHRAYCNYNTYEFMVPDFWCNCGVGDPEPNLTNQDSLRYRALHQKEQRTSLLDKLADFTDAEWDAPKDARPVREIIAELRCPKHDPNSGPGSDQCPTCGRYA